MQYLNTRRAELGAFAPAYSIDQSGRLEHPPPKFVALLHSPTLVQLVTPLQNTATGIPIPTRFHAPEPDLLRSTPPGACASRTPAPHSYGTTYSLFGSSNLWHS